LRCLLVLALLAASTGTVFGDFPPPGQHSSSPKFWRSANRWIENFSPFDFSARIAGLKPDGSGGLWFGLGRTLEHINRSGVMQSVTVSPNWLWQVWSLARDPSHRLWFSIGQSGRIGTIDANGRIHTEVLVPRRYFPDIRQIAFASDGTLFFLDLGRRSIGRRTSDGTVDEVPLPHDRYPVDFTFCNGRPWVVARSPRRIGIFVASSDLRELREFYPFRDNGLVSLGCDSHSDVWFTYSGYRPGAALTGFIDRKNRIFQSESTIRDHHIAGTDDGAWVIGTTSPSTNAWLLSNTTLEHRRGQHLVSTWVLPVSFYQVWQTQLTVSSDQTIWMSLNTIYSIVRLSVSRR
jgi:hypothetical protein